MPIGKCPACKEGEVIYKIGDTHNEGICSNCGIAVAYTWLKEQVNASFIRLNPNLVPDFKTDGEKH